MVTATLLSLSYAAPRSPSSAVGIVSLVINIATLECQQLLVKTDCISGQHPLELELPRVGCTPKTHKGKLLKLSLQSHYSE